MSFSDVVEETWLAWGRASKPGENGFGVCACGLSRMARVRGIWRYSICVRRHWWNFWRHDRPFQFGVKVA